MATVVNNPSDGSNSSGILIGIALLVIALIAFFIFGMSGLQTTGQNTPGSQQNNPQVIPTVPSQIDVNVKLPPKE